MTSFKKFREISSGLILLYLRELAKLQLLKNKPLVIGITGSAGKTSLRQAIQAILSEKFRVKVSSKANSESGIPLNILGIKPRDYSVFDWLRMLILAPCKLIGNWQHFQIYVAEMGIDSPYPPKNMRYLLSIIRPKIGVFLNVLPVHTQYFDKLLPDALHDLQQRRRLLTDLIAKEKGELVKSLPADGVAVLNFDDQRVKQFAGETQARIISFSTQSQAEITARNIAVGLQTFSLDVAAGEETGELKLQLLLDKHYAQTLLAAIAVARGLDISLSDCLLGLQKNFQLPKGRLSVIPGIKKTTLIDSSYNASRQTMTSSLELLGSIAKRRKVAIIGDLRELGTIGKLEHQQVAEVASRTADLIIAVGPLMKKWCLPKLRQLGFPQNNLHWANNAYRAVAIAERVIRQGDTILIKGSQNTIFLEIVVAALMRDKKDVQRLLCRRGEFWEKRRRELLTD